MMVVYRPDIPPHVAAVIRHLPPDLKRSIRQTLRALSSEPFSGEPLLRELEGLWKFSVRRFRIVYEVDRRKHVLRILAVGHRREVYQEIVEQVLETKRQRK